MYIGVMDLPCFCASSVLVGRELKLRVGICDNISLNSS